MVRFVLLVLLASACGGGDPKPIKPGDGELPPLPPASGTAVGYLVDSASQLKLDDEQLEKLKALDVSLAAKNDSIETQLRTMERPNVEEPEKDKPPPRHNNAPGAQVTSSPDAQKLHRMRAANDEEALVKAFAVLDDGQKEIAKRLLQDRGITAPGANTKKGEPPRKDAEGTPVPGMEP
jgi:hypothetical protein